MTGVLTGRTGGNFKSTGIHRTSERRRKNSACIYTDNRITLQSLQNKKRHAHLIDQIRNKILVMEQHEWKADFSWIKAHVGQRGNELADPLAKEASRSKNIEECYNRVPKKYSIE
jgi:ribonuclease HI